VRQCCAAYLNGPSLWGCVTLYANLWANLYSRTVTAKLPSTYTGRATCQPDVESRSLRLQNSLIPLKAMNLDIPPFSESPKIWKQEPPWSRCFPPKECRRSVVLSIFWVRILSLGIGVLRFSLCVPGVSVLSHCISRGLSAEEWSRPSIKDMSWVRICVLLVFVDSWLFLFTSKCSWYNSHDSS
jgi:hypothetical protein